MAKYWLYVSILISLSFAMEHASTLGGAPGALLHASIGSRSQGLGHATVGLLEEGANTFINPASISFLKNGGLQLGGSVLSLGRREGYAAYAHPIRPKGCFGATYLYRGDPSLEIIDLDEKVVEKASHAFHALSFGSAYRLFRAIALGFSFSLFQEKLYKYGTSGTGIVDLGLASRLTDQWTFGACVKNLSIISGRIPWQVETGSQLNLMSNFRLPYQIKLGTTYKNVWMQKAFFFALEEDLFVWQEESPGIGDLPLQRFWHTAEHAGIECEVVPNFTLRAGYDDGRFPMGCGIRHILKRSNVNYCFIFEQNGMGFNHNVEWIWEF